MEGVTVVALVNVVADLSDVTAKQEDFLVIVEVKVMVRPFLKFNGNGFLVHLTDSMNTVSLASLADTLDFLWKLAGLRCSQNNLVGSELNEIALANIIPS